MNTLWHDLKYGARSLCRRPNYTLITLTTMVLAIAAITTTYSLLRQVVLQPLPVAAPDELVSVEVRNGRTGESRHAESVPFPLFRSWQQAAGEDLEIGWAVIESSVLTETDVGVYSAGHFVSPNFLSLVGTEPLHGRWFTEQEAGEPVVVISHDLWREYLDADEDIVGSSISLDGMPFTVIGVMPEGYLKFLEPRVRYWRPVADYDRGGAVIGRTRGQTGAGFLEQQSSVLDRVLQRTEPGAEVAFVPLREKLVGSTASNLWLLMAAVSGLFLVAVLNVTNLSYAHFTDRLHELTTRASLGASPTRIVRQLLVENVMLALVAALGSMLLADSLLELALVLMPDSFPRRYEISSDAPAWMFALTIAIVSGVLATLIPSLKLSRSTQLIERIKQGSNRLAGSPAGMRMRHGLITVQVSVALTLLVAVSLLGESYLNLLRQDIGFNPESVVTGHVWRPESFDDEEFAAAVDRLLGELEALPEVELAATGSTIPMAPLTTRVDFAMPYAYRGQPTLLGGEQPQTAVRTVSDDYFRVLEIPLLEGRFFGAPETASEDRTIIVNEALAEEAWPGESAIGEELLLPSYGETTAFRVVGIVANYRFDSLDADAKPEAFLPMSRVVFASASYLLKIATDDARATMQAMQRIALRLDNSMPMIELRTMSEVVRRTIRAQQSVLSMSLGFAILATVLAGVGIYALTSYLIGSRRHEIAVRMALGASRVWIRRWVIRDAVIPVALGCLFGLVFAALLAGLLGSFLYGIEPRDWHAYVSALGVILVVGLLAPIGPAIRASNVDPNIALYGD